jgi:hypothetical protein
VTVGADDLKVLETVVPRVTVDVVEGHGERAAQPIGDPAQLTPVLLQAGVEEIGLEVKRLTRRPTTR